MKRRNARASAAKSQPNGSFRISGTDSGSRHSEKILPTALSCIDARLRTEAANLRFHSPALQRNVERSASCAVSTATKEEELAMANNGNGGGNTLLALIVGSLLVIVIGILALGWWPGRNETRVTLDAPRIEAPSVPAAPDTPNR
jgi:hypothetical protein